MDLDYSGLYRLFDVASFCFPTSPTDLSVLDHAFDVMFNLMVSNHTLITYSPFSQFIMLKGLVNNSAEKTISFLKQSNEIRTPPLRRQFYVKSFNSPKH